MEGDTRIVADLEVLKALQGEINRRLGSIEKDLGTKFITYTEYKHLVDDVADLAGTKVWIVRIVLAALFAQGLAIVFSPQIQTLIG